MHSQHQTEKTKMCKKHCYTIIGTDVVGDRLQVYKECLNCRDRDAEMR